MTEIEDDPIKNMLNQVQSSLRSLNNAKSVMAGNTPGLTHNIETFDFARKILEAVINKTSFSLVLESDEFIGRRREHIIDPNKRGITVSPGELKEELDRQPPLNTFARPYSTEHPVDYIGVTEDELRQSLGMEPKTVLTPEELQKSLDDVPF